MKSRVWWTTDKNVYVGHSTDGASLIYIGGPYHDSYTQMHVNVEQAQFIIKHLEKVIIRNKKVNKD